MVINGQARGLTGIKWLDSSDIARLGAFVGSVREIKLLDFFGDAPFPSHPFRLLFRIRIGLFTASLFTDPHFSQTRYLLTLFTVSSFFTGSPCSSTHHPFH